MNHLYHITLYGRLPSISKLGLSPGKEPFIGAESLDPHRSGAIFLTTAGGVAFWSARAEEWITNRFDDPKEAGAAPVVVRVPASYARLCEYDEIGARDSRADAYRCELVIPPSAIKLWAGTSEQGRWVPVDEWREVPFDEAFDRDVEDGEVYHLLREGYPSPLIPDVKIRNLKARLMA